MNTFTYSRGTEFKDMKPGQTQLDRFGQSIAQVKAMPESNLTCLVDFGGPVPLLVMVNKQMTFGMLRQTVLKRLHGTTGQVKDVRITFNGAQLPDFSTLEKESMYLDGKESETVQAEIINYTTGMR